MNDEEQRNPQLLENILVKLKVEATKMNQRSVSRRLVKDIFRVRGSLWWWSLWRSLSIKETAVCGMTKARPGRTFYVALSGAWGKNDNVSLRVCVPSLIPA